MQRCARTRQKYVHLRCLTKIQIQVNKNQENAFFGHFWIDTKKSYFIHFCQSGQNIMSLLKQNIHFWPICLTDWTPNPKKPLNPAEKAPLDPPWPPVTPPNPLRWTIFVSTYKLRPVKTIFISWLCTNWWAVPDFARFWPFLGVLMVRLACQGFIMTQYTSLDANPPKKPWAVPSRTSTQNRLRYVRLG